MDGRSVFDGIGADDHDVLDSGNPARMVSNRRVDRING
jgi:hypothetical protein